MKNINLGFAMCGSFCTFANVIPELRKLREHFGSITPIMSEISCSTDTRFGRAQQFISELEEICGRGVICSIAGAEPIGPQALFDVLLVAPCTGNTIAKLAAGIADSSVSMACKSHLRNGRPLVLAVSTNDGLSGNAKNIGHLMARKNIYLVPFYQDDCHKKPSSLVADMSLLAESVKAALEGKQLQPLLLQK